MTLRDSLNALLRRCAANCGVNHGVFLRFDGFRNIADAMQNEPLRLHLT